jgi:hypothetical protein
MNACAHTYMWFHLCWVISGILKATIHSRIYLMHFINHWYCNSQLSMHLGNLFRKSFFPGFITEISSFTWEFVYLHFWNKNMLQSHVQEIVCEKRHKYSNCTLSRTIKTINTNGNIPNTKQKPNKRDNTNRFNLHTRIAKYPAQAKQEDH